MNHWTYLEEESQAVKYSCGSLNTENERDENQLKHVDQLKDDNGLRS